MPGNRSDDAEGFESDSSLDDALDRFIEDAKEEGHKVHPGILPALSFYGSHASPRAPMPRGLEVGQVLDDFRLLAPIAHGGMGQVWEAEQISLERRVALKVVRPDRVTHRVLDLFAREARAGGRLNHPGIITVHAHGSSEGIAWIAMELVEGSWTLRDFLEESAKSGQLAATYYRDMTRFAIELADAMQAAHDADVIHRDLKPRNILITKDDRPKIGDFGLARITDETALSHTGDFAGTYAYMSPEQVAAKRMGIDHRTDIFSLGVVLYEMLTLKRPFEGDTSHQIAAQIVTKEAPDPRSFRSRVPRDLAVICIKCLEKDRDRRYSSMAELAADLRRHAADEEILAQPPSAIDKAARWMRRNPTMSAAMSVACSALVIISWLGYNLASSNETLASTNDELKIKRAEAEANARRAANSASLAESSALAEKRRADEVLRLSVAQDYEDLISRVESLWPAFPARIAEMEDWLADADSLIAQLPELEAKRAELRAGALEPVTEQETRESTEDPEYGTLVRLRTELAARRRSLAVVRGEARVEPADLNWNEYAAEPDRLNAMAWEFVRPGRRSKGREAVGLAMALRAAKLATEEMRSEYLNTAAWGYLALGDYAAARERNGGALLAALPASKDEAQRDFDRLEEALRAAEEPEAIAKLASDITRLESDLEELEGRIGPRKSWSFPEGDDEALRTRWWHNQLSRLIGELDSLESPKTGLVVEQALTEVHGWSVARRLSSARRLREGFAPDGEFARRWKEALPAIRNKYPGLALVPRVPLVPIGQDADSGLFEFWHAQSGTEPKRSEGGRLVLENTSGLVFVLLPGGEFAMGAQSSDAGGANYDPLASYNEGPVHVVELSPFFISKFEVTQGQWEHLTGKTPSRHSFEAADQLGELDKTHPVEQVTWWDCMKWLPKFGMALPSEAQWEYAARGGTRTAWWTGNDRSSLRSRLAANIADQAADRGGASWAAIKDWPEYDDGYAMHAPVDALAPNGFGLHHVHGNLWEWCLDGYERHFYGWSPKSDPWQPHAETVSRVIRGGSFRNTAFYSRSSGRSSYTPGTQGLELGVRPAMSF